MKRIFLKNPSTERHEHAARRVDTMKLVTTICESVPVAIYQKIQSSITWNLPYMNCRGNLVPEDLVGIELWCELTDAEKRMAKACIAHLSQTRVLPIRARDSEIEHPRFYVLDQSQPRTL